ncbi:hypothetical protein ACIQI8_15020 [Streptomyces sp. NPDC092369]|uniref:hypothetical protein n=1 Tax=Streptomyces sp. NPDC092369 TaxID=3366015 RepID=UPI00381D4A4E
MPAELAVPDKEALVAALAHPLSKPEADPCAFSADGACAETPLTSEPPLPDAEPLTSEPPLADASSLTSESAPFADVEPEFTAL